MYKIHVYIFSPCPMGSLLSFSWDPGIFKDSGRSGNFVTLPSISAWPCMDTEWIMWLQNHTVQVSEDEIQYMHSLHGIDMSCKPNNCISRAFMELYSGINSNAVIGLDKLSFFLCLLFLLTILRKSAYYSSLVYPLFQFKDVTFILKRQFICGCYYSITESEM